MQTISRTQLTKRSRVQHTSLLDQYIPHREKTVSCKIFPILGAFPFSKNYLGSRSVNIQSKLRWSYKTVSRVFGNSEEYPDLEVHNELCLVSSHGHETPLFVPI